MIEEFPGEPDFDIALGTTGLFIQENYLIKKEKDGSVTAKYPLASIQSVSSIEKIDPTAFLLLFIGGACGYISYQFVTNNVWKWILYIVAIFVIFLFFGGLKRSIIQVTFQNNKVEYICREENAVVKGFVVSLQEFLRNRKR